MELELQIAVGCYVVTGNQGPLQEQPGLLTHELSLQSLKNSESCTRGNKHTEQNAHIVSYHGNAKRSQVVYHLTAFQWPPQKYK